MLKQSLQLIFRRLKRKAGYSTIHLLGLTAGFTSCLLIFLLVRYEGSFDMHHAKKDRIYRINTESSEDGDLAIMSCVPFPLAKAFELEFPTEAVGRMYYQEETVLGSSKSDPQEIENVYFSEGTILSIFDFNMLQGEGKTALEEPGNILLSASLAKRFFGEQDPVGSQLFMGSKSVLQVAGVYADVPATTHIPAAALISFENLTEDIAGLPMDNWSLYNNGLATYALLDQPLQTGQFEEQLAQFASK